MSTADFDTHDARRRTASGAGRDRGARRSARAACLGLGALVLSACAMAKSPAVPAKVDSMPSPALERPATVEEALAAFDRAEGELRIRVGTVGGSKQPRVEPGSPGPLPSVPQPVSPTANTEPYDGDGDAARCETACRALASMRRAADNLCELTGESDDRCGSVRYRVELSTLIVRTACPACAETAG